MSIPTNRQLEDGLLVAEQVLTSTLNVLRVIVRAVEDVRAAQAANQLPDREAR